MLSVVPHRGHRRPEVIDELRRLMAQSVAAETRPLPFGLPALDAHLPQGGLTCGGLHEVAPATRDDMPAAFGFVAAMLGCAMLGRMPPGGPVLLVTSPSALSAHGRLYGHGLHQLGLDPARVILVETADETQALWAMEEALRSGVPAAVAGAVEKLDFRASQRLHLAAGDSGRPLLLLRPGGLTSVAVTRWRVSAAAAARDRFGLSTHWRWQVTLERCRNGRPGQWLVEFDHASHRFSLAATLADPAVSRSTGARPLRRERARAG
jgi:protein ImuA